ncbi:MAG: OprO/OprP family phosphate-selective porin [Candidatus Krumholzibacteria bacterium]|nr:OprO/OprP family phosphate-selective porin [Candidatus Krumholzibacteria bacterium]
MCVALIVMGATPLLAQTEPTQLERLQADLKRSYFRVGVLFQAVTDLQAERTMTGKNGVTVANARLAVGGELDDGYSYFVQANFIRATSLLDGWFRWGFSNSTGVSIGAMKAPFSGEFLTAASGIDFVNRSLVASILAPGRQIGVQLDGSRSDRAVRWAVGMFNGNGISANVNNGGFMVVGRLTVEPKQSSASNSVTVGLNAAYADGGVLTISGIGGTSIVSDFSGTRGIFGADVRVARAKWLLAAEIGAAQLDPEVRSLVVPLGGHLTGGFMLSRRMQLLARWDHLTTDAAVEDDTADWLIAGFNIWPNGATEWQFNYVVDADNPEPKHHQLLVNVQVAF